MTAKHAFFRLVLIVLFTQPAVLSAQDKSAFRAWRTNSGQRTRVKLAALSLKDGVVRFKRQDDGRQFDFSLKRLHADDQRLLRRQFAAADDPARPAPANVASANGRAAVRWPAPVLNDGNLDRWLRFVKPGKEELKWRNIRWHNNLAEAAVEARRLRRPILLWTMNGNPCGET